MKTKYIFRISHLTATILIIISVFSNKLAAQDNKYSEKDIPQFVMESFHKHYPNATVTGYDIESEQGNTLYEVESKDGNVRRDIEFSADGSIVEIGEYIDSNALPENVKNSVNLKFSNAKILEVEKKTRGDVTVYELLVNDAGKKKEILLNADGNLIKESEDNDEGDKENDNEPEDGD